MKIVSDAVDIAAPAGAVFAFMDDSRNVGCHMTEESSLPMMGSRLTPQILSKHATGLGALHRYSGKLMGLPLDFAESVTKYVPGREKVWQTVGRPRLWIMSDYEMRITVRPRLFSSSQLTVSMAYRLPRSPVWRFIGMLVAGCYTRWRLRRMCSHAKQVLEGRDRAPFDELRTGTPISA